MDGAARARRYNNLRATLEPIATGLNIASAVLAAVGTCTACPPLVASGMIIAFLRAFILAGMFVIDRMEARVKMGLDAYNTPVAKLLPLLIQHFQLFISKANNIQAILDLLEIEHANNRCSSRAAKQYRRCLITALSQMPGQCKDLGIVLYGWHKWSSRNSFNP